MAMIAAALGRILIGLYFILNGVERLVLLNGNVPAFDPGTVTTSLAMPLSVAEIALGLLLALGALTRVVSVLLIAVAVISIPLFHGQVSDPAVASMAAAKLAMIGGLLVTFAYGQMRWSYDHIKSRRKGEVAERHAQAKIHEAELRAARAEEKAAIIQDGRAARPVVTTPV